MKKGSKIILILSILTLFTRLAFSQTIEKSFYSEIKSYDISKIIIADSIIVQDKEGTRDKIEKAKPLGFIGNDYQRFYIHFDSIIRNPKNHYEYLVYGKTKVKQIIRPFKGTVIIKKANLTENNNLFPDYRFGYAICKVDLFEDRKLTSTGHINGDLTISYLIDKHNDFRYNASSFYADRFYNNQFKGTWTSYRTNLSKKCNFGDYRIPNSGDLDIGAAEFSPNSKYFDKGWKYYILSLYGENEKEVETGKKIEKEKWWK